MPYSFTTPATGKVFTSRWKTNMKPHRSWKKSIGPCRKSSIWIRSSTRYFGSSDHVEFLKKGVPAYFCVQNPAHYRQAHHSQTDTFDKVVPDEINEGAAFIAAWAWNVSEMPQALPHHAEREGRGE